MSHGKDVTLTDLNRREIDFPENQVKEVLPEFFRTEYPKLITLLDKYYEFEDSDQSPSRLVNELFYNRDITQVDIDLLSYIEDELLLGQSYFEGFTDKRAAAKYSNTLYRSKGTKYSIEQFFRTFFGVDPEIVYTKELVFNIGDSASQLGFEAQRFITDDKLYQQFALQIKTPLDFNTWREPYKLFVHPAGMFVGSEVLLTSAVEDALTTPAVKLSDPPAIVVSSNASFTEVSNVDLTGLVDDFATDSSGILSRINLDINISDFTTTQIDQINNQYGSLREAQLETSPTFDDTDPLDATTPIINSATAANTFTKQGDATITAALAKFGEGSLLLDGTGDGLLSDNSVDIYDSSKSGTDKNHYTVEMWINTSDVTQIAYLYDNWVSGSTRQPIYINNNKFIVSVNGASVGQHNASLTNNTWHHIAYVKQGAAYQVYTDGVLKGSGVGSVGSGVDLSGTYMIGRAKDQGNTLGFNGYIDEFRLSDSALYTGPSFTLQTAEYPGTDSSTIDLLHFGAETNGVGMDFSNDFAFETFDQDRHVFYSSDSDQYLLNLGHLS